MGARQPLMTNTPGPLLNLQTRLRHCALVYFLCNSALGIRRGPIFSVFNPFSIDGAAFSLHAISRAFLFPFRRILFRVCVCVCARVFVCYFITAPPSFERNRGLHLCDVHTSIMAYKLVRFTNLGLNRFFIKLFDTNKQYTETVKACWEYLCRR